MLKKGSLLSKGEQRNFIYLTIGNPSGYDNYGYRNDPSYIEYKTGAIDRIPYWEWEGADGIFRKWYLGKLFKNPCSQAELNKIVPFGFSLQRQKMVFFCHQNSKILLC